MRGYLEGIFVKTASKEEAKLKTPLEKLLLRNHVEICHAFDDTAIQESLAWRNAHQGRAFAQFLIDERGELKKGDLLQLVEVLHDHLYSLGPERHHEASGQRQVLAILREFYENPELGYQLKRIGRPIGHRVADRLIRETVHLSEKTPLRDAHARQAALAALLTPLRQNVGSCFATAPAILIQQEQPLQFLADIGQLLGTGRLKRVYEGEEYAVPLSGSFGVADLKRPFFLGSLGERPWEKLGRSPGFIAAFEAAGLVKKGAKQQEKEKRCEELLARVFSEEKTADPFQMITPESVIRSALLAEYRVSEEEVRAYAERPKERIYGEVLIRQPSQVSGKARNIQHVLKAYPLAQGGFKVMTDNALLKAWEFSLASLSESKADFARWNLYSSLGFDPQEPGGIGNSWYPVLEGHIQRINEEIEQYQSHYDHLFAQVKSLEGRARRAGTDREIGWIQAEYHVRKLELGRVINEREEAYEKGRKLSNLFPFLVSFYTKKFKEYFQEVYDAEMHDVSLNLYDDSPAGFRLLYKHGRENTALWTLITTPAEYIQALSSFFVATEIELSRCPEVEELQQELTDIVTAAVTHIKREEFLESSFYRLAHAYREPLVTKPLENLDRVKRKPWAYLSGGTMSTLVSCYFGGSKKPKESSRWVENATELLVFYLDTIRELPLSVQKEFQKNAEKALLAFSPTHAFLLKPGWKRFRKGWESEAYTYTWVRDHWIEPQKAFFANQLLDSRKMHFLIEEIGRWIPRGYLPIYKNAFRSFTHSMRPSEFRTHVLKTLSYEGWLRGGNRLQMLAEEIDHVLYTFLPLFPEHQLKNRLHTVFEGIEEMDESLKEKLFKEFEREEEKFGRYKILSAQDLRDVAKALLLLTLKKTKHTLPFHQRITEVMQERGLASPAPILFADTNWIKNTFGFVVNPGTEELELWRFDDCGSTGRPLSIWKPFLDGTVQREWGLYTSPHEYHM